VKAIMLKESLVVGLCLLPGNPQDGLMLEEAIEQVSILADRPPKP
jgi:hypothetical protein